MVLISFKIVMLSLKGGVMKENIKSNKQNQENREERLFDLINQAGNDARQRKQKAMSLHFKKIQDAIAEGIRNRQKHLSV